MQIILVHLQSNVSFVFAISFHIFYLKFYQFPSYFYRSSHPEVFLRKDILRICSKFTGETHAEKFLCNFIEITLWHGCSPVNLLHIFRTPFPRNTSGWLLLFLFVFICFCFYLYSSLFVFAVQEKLFFSSLTLK